MDEEVTRLAGPKGRHRKGRKAYRWGGEQGSVVLGGRQTGVTRPRVRSLSAGELPLESYSAFQDADPLAEGVLERMLYGISCRRYPNSLEPVGTEVECHGVSKSAIDRQFVARTQRVLRELLERRLEALELCVLMVDGVVFAEHTVVTALGIDTTGHKHILGIWEGATENAVVVKALLADLVDRGLDVSKPLLVVIDGSKALRAAVRDVFGDHGVVQRCRVHRLRNVLEHLPKDAGQWVATQIRRAWQESSATKAKKKLLGLARTLEVEHPGAAASLKEGLEETLTITRLGLPPTLASTLSSTNCIESAFDRVRKCSRNVTRWRNGRMVMRWTTAGLLEAEKSFRRIKGYRALPVLIAALAKVTTSLDRQSEAA
jgi:transposase-like protein